ncbi:hypothetical protein TrispH2_000794 [Trichoplax sp. H2]|nr:hypothetical protein TrispH2_000794 [Trichoplax sp. H2]|eukprot:RDD47657.1 hypothetical protein TrispH2_000794 [Trichoplax sp. H2]
MAAKQFNLLLIAAILTLTQYHVECRKDWVTELPNIEITNEQLQNDLLIYRQIVVYYKQPVPSMFEEDEKLNCRFYRILL